MKLSLAVIIGLLTFIVMINGFNDLNESENDMVMFGGLICAGLFALIGDIAITVWEHKRGKS